MWKFLSFCVLLCAISVNSEIPSYIHRCHYGDSSCLVESIQAVITSYSKTGIREINLSTVDPLRVNSLDLKKNPSSPVSVELKFKDLDLIGLQNIKIHAVKGLDAEILEPIQIDLIIPRLILKGPYTVNGKVLILPIVGKGMAEITIDQLAVILKIKAHAKDKSGKKYFEADTVKLELKPKHAGFHLTGLFNENKELGDNMNLFLNENWEDIYFELQPDIGSALALVIKHILNNVFSKHPYASYFAE